MRLFKVFFIGFTAFCLIMVAVGCPDVNGEENNDSERKNSSVSNIAVSGIESDTTIYGDVDGVYCAIELNAATGTFSATQTTDNRGDDSVTFKGSFFYYDGLLHLEVAKKNDNDLTEKIYLTAEISVENIKFDGQIDVTLSESNAADYQSAKTEFIEAVGDNANDNNSGNNSAITTFNLDGYIFVSTDATMSWGENAPVQRVPSLQIQFDHGHTGVYSTGGGGFEFTFTEDLSAMTINGTVIQDKITTVFGEFKASVSEDLNTITFTSSNVRYISGDQSSDWILGGSMRRVPVAYFREKEYVLVSQNGESISNSEVALCFDNNYAAHIGSEGIESVYWLNCGDTVASPQTNMVLSIDGNAILYGSDVGCQLFYQRRTSPNVSSVDMTGKSYSSVKLINFVTELTDDTTEIITFAANNSFTLTGTGGKGISYNGTYYVYGDMICMIGTFSDEKLVFVGCFEDDKKSLIVQCHSKGDVAFDYMKASLDE